MVCENCFVPYAEICIDCYKKIPKYESYTSSSIYAPMFIFFGMALTMLGAILIICDIMELPEYVLFQISAFIFFSLTIIVLLLFFSQFLIEESLRRSL